MKRISIWLCAGLASLFCMSLMLAQQQPHAAASVLVPRLIRFGGVVKDDTGRPLTGFVGITFGLYKEQEGGAALWLETQNTPLEANGRYSVLLGATKSEGVPMELFTSGEARWLGVNVQGQSEQPRVLLVSVPYALKAADAETVGGKPASAFVLAAPQVGAASKSSGSRVAGPSPLTVGGSGTKNFIPIWTNSTTLGNSILFQSSSKVGIGTTSPAAKAEIVVPSEGTLALRLRSGPNSFLDITPTNTGGRFQTVLNTVNNRDVILLTGTGTSFRVGSSTTTPAAKAEIVAPSEGTLALRLLSGPNSFLDITPTNTGGKFQTVFDTLNPRDVVFVGGTQNVGMGTTSPAAKLHVIGNFIATGTKSALVETASYGKRQLYAVESPENWFEDFGGGQLIHGRTVVKLDPIFAETVSTEDEYHVFLTPKGDCKGLYVANQSTTSFEVRELRNGKSSVAFDYRIVAKRKGYERARLAELKDEKDTQATEIKLTENRK